MCGLLGELHKRHTIWQVLYGEGKNTVLRGLSDKPVTRLGKLEKQENLIKYNLILEDSKDTYMFNSALDLLGIVITLAEIHKSV